MKLRCVLFAALTICALALGCGPAAPSTGTVVVGITSELRAGVDIGSLHVSMRAAGQVVGDRTLDETNGPLRFPAELSFEPLEDGTPVEVVIEALPPSGSTSPLIVRAASTEVIGGETRLLRLRLEAECVIHNGEGVCPSTQTCIGGACSDPHVDAQRLEPYSSSWAEEGSDICKPARGGDPIVIVGEGQGDYLPLDDLEEVQVEAGPQGGHHIWVAVRMKNLRRSGSVITVNGVVPALDYTASPFSVIFTFDPDEGGFCKLAGLRFQLDGGIDIHELLGKTVEVEVKVADVDGDSGVGKRTVTLSQDIL